MKDNLNFDLSPQESFGPKHVVANPGEVKLYSTSYTASLSLHPQQIEELYFRLFVDPEPQPVKSYFAKTR